MKRRLMLKQVMVAAAVAALGPACTSDRKKASIELVRLRIDGDQEEILADIVDTLIPETDVPGAKALNVHRFVLKMVDDCYDDQVQTQLAKGLAQIDEFAKVNGETFHDATGEQRMELLKRIQDGDKACPAELLAVYPIIKQLTIQGFMTTQYVLENVQHFELVPGRFHGCVDLASKNKSA